MTRSNVTHYIFDDPIEYLCLNSSLTFCQWRILGFANRFCLLISRNLYLCLKYVGGAGVPSFSFSLSHTHSQAIILKQKVVILNKKDTIITIFKVRVTGNAFTVDLLSDWLLLHLKRLSCAGRSVLGG